MTCSITITVIPAQAGIQTIIKNHTQWGQRPKHGFVRFAELYDKLDSRLRGNDGLFGFARCLHLFKAQ